MASQYGDTRVYSHPIETTSERLTQCPKCKVKVVPKGINDTRNVANSEVHCPNCGHVFGRDNH